MVRVPGALRERPFRLLFVGQAVSLVGDALVPVALAFAVLDLTGSASDLGFVLAAQLVPFVVFLLAGGVVADRISRRKLMLASDLVRLVVEAAVAALLLSGTARIWQLIVLNAVFGTAEAFFRPASTGLTPATVSPADLQQANALLGMSRSFGNVIGPAIAGVLVATIGPGAAIAVNAGTFAVSAAFLAVMRPVRPEAPLGGRSFARELSTGWQEFRSLTWLWVEVAAASLFLLGFDAPFRVLGPLVAKHSLGGASAWAAIVACGGAGAVLGGAVAMRYRPRRPLLLCNTLTLLAVPTGVLLAIPAPLPLIAACQFLGGGAFGLFGAVWETTMQRSVPPDKLSRVSAYDWMGSVAMMPIGLAVAGPVSVAFGVRATLVAASIWGAGTMFLALSFRAVRELRTDEPLREAA